MKSITNQIQTPFILLAILLIIGSCEEVTDSNPKHDSDPPVKIDPEKASEYLKLSNATKIDGDLPTASDGGLKINVKDTIYLVHGLPFGDRLVVKHDGSQDITGFYIEVTDGTFYYNVPVVSAESGDSTEVFYINMELPSGINWEFPYTIPIRIQPHGPDGSPLDEFEIEITIEGNDKDNADPCSPLTPAPTCFMDVDGIYTCKYAGGVRTWEWEFTVVEDASGDIYSAFAPFMFLNIPTFKHGGCCWNGFSWPQQDDPYCRPGNSEYFEVTVDNAYYVRYYEYLDLFDDNTFQRNLRHETSNYSPDSTNYCSGEVGYKISRGTIQENGTHDYSQGDGDIHFKREHFYDSSDPNNVYNFWSVANGNIFYTCHSLIISYIFNGEKWSDVYQRNSRPDGAIDDSFQPEFYE